MNKLTTYALMAAASTATSQAALTWTGGGDAISLYQEANWQDDQGFTPAANTINGGADITADTGGLIEISSGTGTPSNFGGTFQTGSGNSLTVGGGKTLASAGRSDVTGGGAGTTLTVEGGATLSVGDVSGFENHSFTDSTVNLSSLTTSGGTLNSTNTSFTAGTAAINDNTTGSVSSLNVTSSFTSNGTVGVVFNSLTLDGATASLTGMSGDSNVYLTNGSTWASTFLTNGVDVFIDATSSLSLAGAGDPINSQSVQTTINLEVGAQLTLASLEEFTEQGADIFVNGVSFANDTSILSFNGTTATAVPEPTSSVMIGLVGLGFILRRRR